MKGRSKVHAPISTPDGLATTLTGEATAPISTTDGMTTTLSGEATASGDDAQVTGSITAVATDDGSTALQRARPSSRRRPKRPSARPPAQRLRPPPRLPARINC
jgi:hypothetical protein